jgi:large subunit ribosomal protein L29
MAQKEFLKPKQIRELSIEEIKTLVRENKEKLFNLKFRMRSKLTAEKNTQQVKLLRRYIARLLTILREKERTIANAAK